MGLQHLQPWWLVFPWGLSYRQVTGPDIIFQHASLLWIGIKIPFSELSWVSLSSLLVGKFQTLTFIKFCEYVGLSGHSSPRYQANSFPIVCAVLTRDSWNYCSGEQGLVFGHMASMSLRLSDSL